MNFLSILPSGYGTYIVATVGIIGTWAIYGLEQAKIIGASTQSAAADLCAKVTTGAVTGTDLDALAQACSTLSAGPLSITGAVTITWGLITALFLRRAISNAAPAK